MRQLFKYILLFILTATILILALFSVARIPAERIRDNLAESAEYLTEEPSNFRWVIPGVEGSRVDLYADSMLINIALYLDAEHPVESTMWARYYWESGERINASFLKAVTENPEPNREYVRYWHGSLIFVMPMLLIWNLQEMFVFHAVLLTALFFVLVFLLFRHRFMAETVCFCIAMIMVNMIFVPFCLEYYWVFLLMCLASIAAILLTLNGKCAMLPGLFLIFGIATAFLDFFTTETLTILIPLLLVLRIQERQSMQAPWKKVIMCGVLWSVGYVGMWSLKWGLASLILGENMMAYVTESIQEHLGSIDKIPGIQVIGQGLLRNILSLFPFNYGILGALAFFVFILTFLYLVMRNRIMMKQNVQKSWLRLYLFLGCLPFIRFIAIRHHSWFHYFFTHRALASTILALCFIILELVRLTPRKAVMKNVRPYHPDALPE